LIQEHELRESNRLFSLEVARVQKTANFIPSCVIPMTFVKFSPTDPARKCVVSANVDDFRILDNASELTHSLITALEARFGKLTTHDPSTTFAGIEFNQLPTGVVVATQAQYISRVAVTIGVAHLPSVDIVAHKDFFLTPLLLSDCVPVNSTIYQMLTGQLVQALKTHDDVRPYFS